MSPERLLAEGKVANFWRIYPTTLLTWRTHGYIAADAVEKNTGDGSRYYLLSTIEQVHAKGAVGFSDNAPQPTVAQLLMQPQGLLTVSEVMERLGEERYTVLRWMRYGRLPGFQIGPTEKVMRIPVTSLAVVTDAPDGLIHPEVARRVLCLKSTRTIHTLGKSGALRRKQVKGRGSTFFVERDSLLELLGKLVPPLVTPEEWLRLTLADTEEAIDITHLRKRYRIAHRTLTNMMAEHDESLVYIRTINGGATRFPQWAVRRFLEQRASMPISKLALVFGADEATAQRWIEPKTQFCQRRHGRAYYICPSLECVLGYIEQHRTNATIDPKEWLARSLQDGATPILSGTLADELPGTDAHFFEESVETNRTDAVRMPDGQLSIVRADAIAMKRRTQRQLYKEYHLGFGEYS